MKKYQSSNKCIRKHRCLSMTQRTSSSYPRRKHGTVPTLFSLPPLKRLTLEMSQLLVRVMVMIRTQRMKLSQNPWPYLKHYYHFVSSAQGSNKREGYLNVEFQCKLLKPKKIMKANISSRGNLVRHVKAFHPGSKEEFRRLLAKNSKKNSNR